MNDAPVTEAELHQWLDGVLSPGREAAVGAYLDAHPEETRRLDAYHRVDTALHRAFDPVLDEPLPEALRTRPRRGGAWLVRAAAASLLLVVGGTVGWHLKPVPPIAAPWTATAQAAGRAHAVYSVEVRHPVEVAADQEKHLAAWLSKRLGAPLRPPHLAAAGYALVGGRLLPGTDGPAAQFMYEEPGGRRLTLYVQRDATDRGVTAFRYRVDNGIGVFYWVDGDFGYALSGELDRAALLDLAETTYRALNP